MSRICTRPSSLRSTCLRILIPVFNIVLLASVSPARGEEWTAIDELDAYLVFANERLDLEKSVLKRMDKSKSIFEYGIWTAGAASMPLARLFLARLKDHIPKKFVFVERRTLQAQIQSWFADEKLSFSQRGIARNVIGELEFQRFTRRGPYACVGMRQYIELSTELMSSDHATSGVTKGNMFVEGYYCEIISLTDDRMMQFLGAIGIRGYAVPKGGEVAVIPGREGLTCEKTTTGDDRVKVAIFPPGRGVSAASGGISGNIESEILNRLSAFVNKNESLKLAYLTAASACQRPEIENDPTQFWEGIVDKEPIEEKVYAAAELLDADVVLLVSWRATMANVHISLHLFDLHLRKMYEGSVTSSGTDYQKDLEMLTEEIFAEQMRSAGM